MNSEDLTAAQLDAMIKPLARQREYQRRLLARCIERGFPEPDAVRVAAQRSVDAIENLLEELHRLYKAWQTPVYANGRKRWDPKGRDRRARRD